MQKKLQDHLLLKGISIKQTTKSHKHVPTFNKTLAGNMHKLKILRTKTNYQDNHHDVATSVTISTI